MIKGQTLDVCRNGPCLWTNPPSSSILVCLSGVGSCTVNCNDNGINSQCQGLIIYNLSPSLTVNCDYPDSCKYIKIYCGPFEPPNIGDYGLTSNDFSNTNVVNNCNLISNTMFNNVGQYAQMYCTGKVTNCNAQSTNIGMNDIVLYCNGITQTNSRCHIFCQTTNECNNGTIYCINSNSDCYKESSAIDVDIIYTTTVSPTIYPTEIPSANPNVKVTLKPTNIPTIAPSQSPIIIIIPTQAPSVTPTNTPSTSIPSTIPTKMPSDISGKSQTGGPTILTNGPTKSPVITSILSLAPTKTPTNIPTTFDSQKEALHAKTRIGIIIVVIILLLLLIGALIYILFLKRTQQKQIDTIVAASIVNASASHRDTRKDSDYYTPGTEGDSRTSKNSVTVHNEGESNIIMYSPSTEINNVILSLDIPKGKGNVITDELIAKEFVQNQSHIRKVTEGLDSDDITPGIDDKNNETQYNNDDMIYIVNEMERNDIIKSDAQTLRDDKDKIFGMILKDNQQNNDILQNDIIHDMNNQ